MRTFNRVYLKRTCMFSCTMVFLVLFPSICGAKKHFIGGERSNVETYVDSYRCTRGSSPAAAAMALSYSNNKYRGYGNLIRWYHIESESGENVSQLVDILADKMGTDEEGKTYPYKVHSGIQKAANEYAGYNYTSRQVQASNRGEGKDWCWNLIKKEIDNDRPFVWTVQSTGATSFSVGEGRSMAAVGYTDRKCVIVRNPNAPNELEYWKYNEWKDDHSEAFMTQVDTIERGGGYSSTLKLISPGQESGETFYKGQVLPVKWQQYGRGVKKVKVWYSKDHGNRWTCIQQGSEYFDSRKGTNEFSWSVPTDLPASKNYRIRLEGYDADGVLRACDGSVQDFELMEKPVGTVGTEAWLVEVGSKGNTGSLMVIPPTGHNVTIAEGDTYRWEPKLEIPSQGNDVIKISANQKPGDIEWHIWLDLDTSTVRSRFLETGEEQKLAWVKEWKNLALEVVYEDESGWELRCIDAGF